MALVLMPTPTHTASVHVATLRTKARRLDALGDQRALIVLNGLADHFLAAAPSSDAARRANTLARLRACGASLCVAYLEREGTHG